MKLNLKKSLLLVIIILGVLVTQIKFKYKEYNLPNNIRVLHSDDNNLYVQKKEDNNIYIYDLDKGNLNKYKKPIYGEKIINMVFSDDWIVWIEESNLEYKILYENIDTGNISEINNMTPSYIPTISIDNDYLVYSRLNESNFELVLLNLMDKDLVILETLNSESNEKISIPSISENLIVWSKSNGNYSNLSSNIYMYDISKDSKILLSENNSIIKPQIKNNIIIATNIKDNSDFTESYLTKYDLKNSKWNEFISNKSKVYNDVKNLSVDDPLIGENYISWWDNYSNKLILYDIKKEKTITLKKEKPNEIKQIYFLKDNIIVYRIENDNGSEHKCIKIK